MQELKQHIILACQKLLQDKLQSLMNMMQEITDSANNETKSSAGDKHETGRAMMQLEQEKLSKQVKEAEEQLTNFEKCDFTKSSSIITHGSFIETSKGYFLIVGALGKMIVDEKTVFVISAQSPLGKSFLGKEKNDNIVFNSVNYQIMNIG